jgi:hypothetical protein
MKRTKYTTDQLISMLLTAKEALELGVAQHPRDFDHVIRHRIDIVVRSLTTVKEGATQ